ncbi:MAG: hypothetical protein QOD30_1537 [Actinomycetota bacterium]|nr:hypothetical protein [Actinomycetota bacterium]
MAVLRRPSAVVLAGLLLAGCGLGDKAQRADSIINSTKVAFAAGTASGTITTSMRFLRLPDGVGGLVGSAGGSDDASGSGASQSPTQQLAQAQMKQIQRDFSVRVDMDMPKDQASVSLPKSDKAFAIYDGLTSYGRRWSAGPRDARPWVRVDGRDINEGDEIDPTEDAPSFFAFALNPVLLVDLISGPLSGSVKKVGIEKIGRVTTTHYTANFDIEKVQKHTRRKRFPEDTRKATDDVLKVLAVSGKVHKGEVWIDSAGLPRQFTIRLKEEPIRHFVIEHTITLRLNTFGSRSTLVVPTARERIDVRSVVQYLRATIPSPRTPEFLAFLGVTPPATAPATSTTTTVAPLVPADGSGA